MRQIQFISTSPEELEERIAKRFDAKLEILKSHFQPKNPEEYLTLDETAKALKVDKSTLHNWRKRGVITAYQIGNRVYTKRSEIESAIQPIP